MLEPLRFIFILCLLVFIVFVLIDKALGVPCFVKSFKINSLLVCVVFKDTLLSTKKRFCYHQSRKVLRSSRCGNSFMSCAVVRCVLVGKGSLCSGCIQPNKRF